MMQNSQVEEKPSRRTVMLLSPYVFFFMELLHASKQSLSEPSQIRSDTVPQILQYATLTNYFKLMLTNDTLCDVCDALKINMLRYGP